MVNSTEGNEAKDRHSADLAPAVVSLSWVSLLTDIGSEMIYPLLPGFIARDLGGGKLSIGWMEGLATSVAALLRLPSGAISDRMPRRKPMLYLGYGLSSLLRPTFAIASSAWHVVAIRFIERMGKGLRGAPRDALIADVTAPELRGRAFGFNRAMDHLGAAIGPAITFLLLTIGLRERTIFALSLLPGLAVLWVLIFWVKEPKRTLTATAASGKFDLGLTSLAEFSTNFHILLAAMIVFTLANSSDAFLLTRAEEVGISRSLLPLLWLGLHLLKSLANYRLSRWVDFVDPRLMVIAGWLIYACLYAGFGYFSDPWAFTGLLALYPIYFGLVEAAEKTLVARWAGPERRGSAFGWFSLAEGIAAFPSSILFGALYQSKDFGTMWAFGSGACLAVFACALFAVTFFLPKTDEHKSGKSSP